MRTLLLLLSLCVWVGCTPVSSMEIAKQKARGRLHIQELSQVTRQFRNICQEYLDMNREALVLLQTGVPLAEQILTYKAEATRLIKQKLPGAGERAREISAALQSINTRMLAIAAEFHAKAQRQGELLTQIKTLSPPELPDDLSSWALSESKWAIEQGRRSLAETMVLCEQAQQVRRTWEPLSQRFSDVSGQLEQDPLDSLIDRLEQIAI